MALVIAAVGTWYLAADQSRASPALAVVTGCGIIAVLAMAVVQAALVHEAARGRARLAEALGRVRENEARARAMQEAASDALVAFDTRSRIVEWNGAAERLFGHARAETMGRDGVDLLVPPDRREFVRTMLARFATDGRYTHLGQRLELTLLGAGGQPIAVDVGLAHYRTSAGLVFALHLRDLRTERDAAAALRASEHHHRVVVDGLREIIFQTDRSGVLTYLNLAWRRATRFTLEESLGRRLSEFVTPEDGPKLERLIEALAARADGDLGVEPVEASFRTAEEGRRVMLVNAQPLRDAAGVVTGVVGTVEDVTERRATEVRLRDQLRFNRGLLEAIPVPLSVRGPDGTIIAVNRAWESFAGVAREAVLGRTMRELFPGVVAEDLDRTDRDILAVGGSATEERLLRAAGGVHRPVLYCRSAFIHEDGSAAGLITAFVDIAEQKHAEAAAREARDAAEHANLAKVRFLKALSHEVRNPLAGILGMTGLALETRLDDEQREYLGAVQSSAESLRHIIDDVLDLPRIEAGDMVIERAPCDVRAVAGTVMRTIALAAREREVELLIDVHADVHRTIEGDANRLRQVLLNLVSNAVKFTERGEVEITVAPSGEGRVAVAVRDTGCGMDAATRAALVESMDTARAGTAGIGNVPLGVGIVARLVELLGGSRIDVESAPGAGTTVRFDLPARPIARADASSSLDPQVTALAGRTAIVVMRHPRAAALLGRLLDERGLHATVTTPDEAASLAAIRRFDLAFVDATVVCAAGDGYALAARLRAAVPRLVTCMLLDPGLAMGDAIRQRRDGIAGYLRKPVLEQDVDRLLAGGLTAAAGMRDRRIDATGTPTAAMPRHLRKAHVLVVEDHPVNQAMVRRRLENMGHEVTIAGDGADAITITAERRFDLVLMDLEMPGVDGFTATRAIRTREAEAGLRTPIIALTGHAYDHDRAAAYEAGMDGYLAKPVSPAALAQVLQQHVDASDDSIATRGFTENSNDNDRTVRPPGIR
jgi:PAS domain S-box-containing protein